MASATITFTANSVLKPSPLDSSELDAALCRSVSQGDSLELADYENALNGHVRIELDKPIATRKEWYAWPAHCQIDSEDEATEDIEQEHEGPFNLPGYTSTFYGSAPILVGGSFSWNEATKNRTRIPVGRNIVEEIMRIADTMESVREKLGNRPILVTSWYRDPATNRRVRGASKSRHLGGGAVDFKVLGRGAPSAAEVQKILDPWWGSKGGLASASTFTHIDNRGYRARWRYGR